MVTPPSVSDSGPPAGAQFTLSATVRNDGEGTAAATTLRYHQSTDATITTTDTALETVAIAGLAVAGSSSQSVDLTAPASPGTYYYGACVHPVTDESDTTNNCSGSVEVTVPEPERPDLVVTAPRVSNSGPAAGAEFTLSAMVRNDGEGTAAATTLRYYQSTDARITATDTALGTVAIAGLAGSGSSSQSVELTAPASPGAYYYGACVDPVTDESDTTNNCSGSVAVTVPEPERPDLVVRPPSVSDSNPAAGAEFTLSAMVRNDGEGTAAATMLRYYQSTDATITATDTSVGTVAIAGLAGSGSSSQSVELTAPSRPGTYYYGACVDPVTDESDTTNNCSTSVQVTVQVAVPEPQGHPDLMVTSPSVSDSGPAAGAQFTLSATVQNDGEGTSAATTLTYYRSADATITTSDTAVKTVTIAGLAASGSSGQSVDLTAPASPGTYYYGACVDPVPDESDTANNCSDSVPVTVPEPKRPDLVVTSPSVNDSGPAAAAQFTLSATVQNDGEGSAAATTLTYYRSADATITTSDTAVGTVTIARLAAVGSSSQSVDLTAPSSPGTYYYGACVHPVTDESDTTNNCSDSVPVTVPEPKRPDLVVTSPSVNDSGPAAGAQFTLSATVQNDGEGSAAATTLTYYQSTDATITTTDTLVGTVAIARLAAAGSSSQSVDPTAPSRPGTYYYGACVDPVGDESDTTNNCSASVPVTVTPKSVEVTPRDLTFAALGDTAELTARVLDAQDNEIFGEEVSWSSLSPEVATVNAAGVVTAVANGIATVTASASGVSGEATVTVWQRAASVAIDPGEVELTSVGDTASLTLLAFDANGHEAPDGGDITSWSWRSANLNVAIVSSLFGEAQVRAVGAGTTEVTVAAETEDGVRLSGTATVTVTIEQYPDLEVETPTVSDATPETGASFTLSATVSNAGDGESPATTLHYYQSTDAPITRSDTEVGTDEVEGLAASGTTDESISLTAPESPGPYYYGACVDAVTNESDTTNNCSDSVPVTVSEPEQSAPSVEIGVEDDKEWAPVGDTVDLSARVLDDEGEEITGTTVRWSSSNTAVATVDSSGVMTAVGEGTVTLTATATVSSSSTQSSMARSGAAVEKSEETVSGSVRMTVVKRAARIDISPASVSLDSVGGTAYLTATIYDEADNVMRPTYWGWSSADTAVATAHGVVGSEVRGYVKAIGEGTTTVSMRANGSATGTASVTVTLPVARVEVSPIELTFLALGATKTVTVRVLDENGVEDEDASFSYIMAFSPCCGFRPGDTLNSLAIERVDDGLKITAEGTGSGHIRIRSSGVESAIVLVRVYQVPASLTISPDSATLAVGATATLRASVMDANGHDMTVAEGGKGGLTVYWETSDSDVATVDGADDRADRNTGATATVTAAAAGTATITGRHGRDVTGTATITVTAPQPDLMVGSPSVNESAPAAGAPFTLSATVENEGEGESEATTLTYYRSTDATITTSDTEVGTDAVAALAASGSSAQSVELTAPASPDTYYYGACVDAVPDESDTTNNCSASVQVTVPEPEQSALSVEISAEDDKEWAPVGDTVDLSARVLDDEGEEVTGTTVRWSSSNTAVATVSSSGVMTAVGEGTVTLTATATVSSSSTQSSRARSGAAVEKSEDTVSGSVSMIVVKRAARIDISPASVSFDSVGEFATLTATVYDEADNVMRPTYWGWSSADTAVATAQWAASSEITAFVQAIGEGTTTVSMRANGSATGTASVTVTLPVARVEVSPIELTFLALGDTKTVTVRVLDENGDEDEDASFDYFKSFQACCGFEPGDTIKTLAIERVDDGLEITAEGTGRGTIRIDSSGVESAIVRVTVNQVAASLTVSPDSATLAVDETATLRASVMDANGHDIKLAEGDKGGLVVYWETSDSDVATVDGADDRAENTGATATVTAAAAGTATITGRHGHDVIGTATITVTVPEPDLVVAAPTVSNNAPDAGATFTLSATVRNDGDEASAATTLRYYRSTGRIITTSDTEVGTDEVGELAASGTSDESVSLTATLPAGTYYYGACVDAVTDESDTTNNCSSSVPVTVAPPAHPDLVIYAVTTGTNPFGGTGPGGLIQMSAGVRNQGGVASPATTMRFYQSTDATITTSDTEVGMDDVGALAASETRSHGADVHAPATTGTYYYGACVDSVTDEFDTTNNCSGSIRIEVTS